MVARTRRRRIGGNSLAPDEDGKEYYKTFDNVLAFPLLEKLPFYPDLYLLPDNVPQAVDEGVPSAIGSPPVMRSDSEVQYSKQDVKRQKHHSFTACSSTFERLAKRLSLFLDRDDINKYGEGLFKGAIDMLQNCIDERKKDSERSQAEYIQKREELKQSYLSKKGSLPKNWVDVPIGFTKEVQKHEAAIRSIENVKGKLESARQKMKDQGRWDQINVVAVGTRFQVTIKAPEGDIITTVTTDGEEAGPIRGGRKTRRKRVYRRFT